MVRYLRVAAAPSSYFAFSHMPYHEVAVPERTFTVTCLRDPSARLLSLYRMLMGYKANNVPHPCMKEQGKWLGNCFSDFLRNIPEEHLLNQLNMFSSECNVDEAFETISSLSYFSSLPARSRRTVASVFSDTRPEIGATRPRALRRET